MKLAISTILFSTIVLRAKGFAFVDKTCRISSSSLKMGLFDGVKEAFSAPALERSTLDAERETPIDRWMGWNANKEDDNNQVSPGSQGKTNYLMDNAFRNKKFFCICEISCIDVSFVFAAPSNFVDSMDEVNYVTASIEKPMGIVFEENDEDYGGIFLLSLKEGGHGEKNGLLKPGDQLIAVDGKQVSGMSFDDALGTIVESENSEVKMTFFRGSPEMFYGPTGASKEWLEEFLSKA